MSCLSGHAHDVVKDFPVKSPGSDITGRCKNNRTGGNAWRNVSVLLRLSLPLAAWDQWENMRWTVTKTKTKTDIYRADKKSYIWLFAVKSKKKLEMVSLNVMSICLSQGYLTSQCFWCISQNIWKRSLGQDKFNFDFQRLCATKKSVKVSCLMSMTMSKP